MPHTIRQKIFSRPTELPLSVLTVLLFLPITSVQAQNSSWGAQLYSNELIEFTPNASTQTIPTSLLDSFSGFKGIEVDEKGINGQLIDEALDYKLGIGITPFNGFNFRADAWRLEVDEGPANKLAVRSEWITDSQRLFIDDSNSNILNPGANYSGQDLLNYPLSYPLNNSLRINSPFSGSALESNGIDLGASYAWESSRFGHFTLSTKATYFYDNNFDDRSSKRRSFSGARRLEASEISDLQSSLMLTWQFGNHTASAITHYFDTTIDLEEMDLEEINEFVDDIATVDFQYGYSVKSRNNDQTVISFGIRNAFGERTSQKLNTDARVLDRKGRVAYGSIKYQF